MTSKRTILIIASLAVAIAVALFVFTRTGEAQTVVVTVPVEQGDIATIVTSTGTIEPVDTVAVGTQVSGIIKAIYTDYNAAVTQGQLLAELDPTLMQAMVDQMKGALLQATSNLNYEKANYQRQKELFDVGAISKAAYDLAINSHETANANVASIKAQLVSAQQNLAFTKIYSPIDGVVLNRSVSVGQTVAASFNTPTLFSLAKDITKMQVQAKVDEADIGEIKAGLRATFTVDAFVQEVFNGSVKEVRLQPTTSSNVVTYTTIIETSNDDMKLKPGMTATVTIYTHEDKNALLVPNAALKFAPDPQATGEGYQFIKAQERELQKDEAKIWVLRDQQLEERIIKTGITNSAKMAVLSGLKANENVVTGVETMSKAEAEAGGSASPFMPTPPRRR